MPKPSKPYNNGQWTIARFNSFIKGALRSASNRWGPKHSVLKKARTERGIYCCAGFHIKPHVVPVTRMVGKKRIRNVSVDHIIPIMDGSVTWDDVIKRMFCEEDGLQVLCKECHDKKTKEERAKRNDTKDKS